MSLKIKNRQELQELLQKNKGLLILKFGATWCGPCKAIENIFYQKLHLLPSDTTTCVLVDIDESFDVFAFLKSKKIITGIPAILAYEAGNTHYAPNDIVIGADFKQIDHFFSNYM